MMKLYEYEAYPSPRRVRMFLAEKGISIPCVQVNVPAGEHRSAEYLSKNPEGVVPLLELDNGEYISETVAISRYFEENHPQTPLMGTTAECGDKPGANDAIEMSSRRTLSLDGFKILRRDLEFFQRERLPALRTNVRRVADEVVSTTRTV